MRQVAFRTAIDFDCIDRNVRKEEINRKDNGLLFPGCSFNIFIDHWDCGLNQEEERNGKMQPTSFLLKLPF